MNDHWRLMYPTEFLAWPEFRGKEVTLTIKSVSVDDLPLAGTSQKERKPVVRFIETEKKLCLAKTNARQIAELLGPLTAEWVGKRITLYPDPSVKFGRKTVGGIRVRDKLPPPKRNPQPPPAEPDLDRAAERDTE